VQNALVTISHGSIKTIIQLIPNQTTSAKNKQHRNVKWETAKFP